MRKCPTGVELLHAILCSSKPNNSLYEERRSFWKARHSCWIYLPPAFGSSSLLQLKRVAVKLVARCSVMFLACFDCRMTQRLRRTLINHVHCSGESVYTDKNGLGGVMWRVSFDLSDFALRL